MYAERSGEFQEIFNGRKVSANRQQKTHRHTSHETSCQRVVRTQDIAGNERRLVLYGREDLQRHGNVEGHVQSVRDHRVGLGKGLGPIRADLRGGHGAFVQVSGR